MLVATVLMRFASSAINTMTCWPPGHCRDNRISVMCWTSNLLPDVTDWASSGTAFLWVRRPKGQLQSLISIHSFAYTDSKSALLATSDPDKLPSETTCGSSTFSEQYKAGRHTDLPNTQYAHWHWAVMWHQLQSLLSRHYKKQTRERVCDNTYTTWKTYQETTKLLNRLF